LVFASVTEGDYYTCGVTTTGAAYCWGGLLFGPLDHRIIGTLTPVAVPGGHRFASVSAGQFQVCGVTTDGAAYCWGDLGMGDLTLDPATLSACNSKWDCPTPVPVPGGLTFASLSLGDLHRCGVTTNGAAYCWGNDPAAPDVTTPQPVPGGLTFAMVSAGGGLTCGVTTAGDAYCWGNAGGALGDGTTTGSTVPVKVAGGLTFKTVSGGDGHACGITTDGTTYCWGFNNWGALGDSTSTNSTVPVMVAGGHTFATISAQWYSTCAVTTAGAAYCWGADFTAAPGGVPGDLLPSSTPVRVPGGLTFATLSTGFVSHRCGVTTGGTAYCWGMNSDGELGNGTTTQSGVPVKVAGQP
jgi:alpha-tubulin suppressor-like RCC1 family protein